jgi:hypothetical protein
MAKKAGGRPSTRTLLLVGAAVVVGYILYRRRAASGSASADSQPVPSYFYPTPGEAPSSNAQPVSYGGGTASQPVTGGTPTGGYVPYQTYSVGGKTLIGGGKRT